MPHRLLVKATVKKARVIWKMGGLSLSVSTVLSKFKPCSSLRKYGRGFLSPPLVRLGFPGGSNGKKKKKNLHAMQETWGKSLDREDPLKKGMATHSSFLAWRIPWTEQSDGLQSMGCKESGTPEGLRLTTRLRCIIMMNSMSAYFTALNRKSNNILK